MRHTVRLRVNDREYQEEAESRQLLAHFLRETLGLTGTHIGCVVGECGACTVLVDGRAVKSCLMLAAQADGSEILTIEGLEQGGSLAHADPAADMAAAALALDGELRLVGPSGERWVQVEDFFTGFFSTVLGPDEILTEVRVPASRGWTSAYLKAAPKPSGFGIAGIAVCLRQAEDGTCADIRIGVTGVSDRPFRAHAVEDALRGQRLDAPVLEEAAALLTDGLWIADDIRASSTYRAHIARVYTVRAIRAARDAGKREVM